MDARKKAVNFSIEEDGQAIVEMLIFLPFMLLLFSILSGVGNAINVSINQQKVTRSYTYMNLQHNSKVFSMGDSQANWTKFGMYMIGWKEKFRSGGSGETGDPLAPCVKINIPIENSDGDSCEATGRTQTQYVRIETVYGLCGPTYETASGAGGWRESVDVASQASCLILTN